MSDNFYRILFFPNGVMKGLRPFAIRYKLNDYPSMCGTILVKDFNASFLFKTPNNSGKTKTYTIRDYNEPLKAACIELRHEIYKLMFKHIANSPACNTKGLILCGDRDREILDYTDGGFAMEKCKITLDEFMRVNEFHRGPQIRNPNHPNAPHMIYIGSRDLPKKIPLSPYFKGWTIVYKRNTEGVFREDGSLVETEPKVPERPAGMPISGYEAILSQIGLTNRR